jgi:hypothetical protein
MTTATSNSSTATASATAAASASSSTLAASAKFKAFAVVFGISFTVIYVLCEVFGYPMFTYHPATNLFDWGRVLGRSGEGPPMYWYGWLAWCLVGGAVLGILATFLPGRIINRIPLFLLWLLPILAFIPLAYGLMPFWTK